MTDTGRRTVSGRSADGQQTVSGRSADGPLAPMLSWDLRPPSCGISGPGGDAINGGASVGALETFPHIIPFHNSGGELSSFR